VEVNRENMRDVKSSEKRSKEERRDIEKEER
jgi:hypothetical protein